MRKSLLVLILLAACGRTLTPAETDMARDLMGDSLDTAPIRFAELGVIGLREVTYPARPRITCRERIGPVPDRDHYVGRTAGAVAFNQVMTNPDFTLPDYMPGYPQEVNLIAAMFFAHELTHIWQWQNRAVTGYHPLRGALEHKPGVDPYLFDPQADLTFLDLGYEQQAALVEEFVCCRTLAPKAARTERLWQVLSQAMPVAHPHSVPAAERIFGVDAEADLDGICD